MQIIKKLAAQLPHSWQTELKRIHFGRQIRKGRFVTNEPEYHQLDRFIRQGDWVIDIGANIGHYTKRFSELVGANGRVLSFEPAPTTFSLLAANVQRFSLGNVTLLNAAVSDKVELVGMAMPKFDTGLANYYEAHVTTPTDGEMSVLTLSLDSLAISQNIALIKVDAEGHEAFVLAGMRKLIEATKPVLIVETDSPEVISDLHSHGYNSTRLPDSPNVLFQPEK